jgi:glycolate oxidase FAD binding subunit
VVTEYAKPPRKNFPILADIPKPISVTLTANNLKQELCHTVATSAAVSPQGGGSKQSLWPFAQHTNSPLSQTSSVIALDMNRLSGIVTYDPSEFLITAWAGTSLTEIHHALLDHGQYLPFDPVLVGSNATLGGTIASGISGPNRMLYGSLRDFAMEVELVDGLGRIVRGGGKVVKNAAGFDLPKLMVGSYGRLGVLIEATLKVFPKPAAYITLRIQRSTLVDAVSCVQLIQTNPLPVSAIEIEPNWCVTVRFAGRPEALENVQKRVQTLLGGSMESVPSQDEALYWNNLRELQFANSSQTLIRVAISSGKVPALDSILRGQVGVSEIRYSAGCSVAWIVVDDSIDASLLDSQLRSLNLSAVVLRGPGLRMDKSASNGLLLLGDKTWVDVAERVRVAMDPEGKFSGYR